MKNLAPWLAVAALAAPSFVHADITSVLGGSVPCTVQTGGNAGERHCSGIFTTFDGAPIDVNVGFPPAPAAGVDGDYPVVGIFHGWGGAKISLTSSSAQQWLDKGYAVFSMSDRGWGSSCGGLDPKRLQPGVCDNGYNHLMDTRYEVRDAQEAFEALADQAATGAAAGEGLIHPQKIAATGGSYGGGISMALGALRNRKMMGAHEGSPNLDGYLVPWVSDGGKAMSMAAVQPDIPWTDMPYSLQPNGHTLDYVADAPYDRRGRGGILKQSFVAGLYALGQATSNYAPPGTDPDANLPTWFAVGNAGEPYDDNPVALDIVDELSRHHSSYYIDDSVPPAPMLISNGFTDDIFPVDEALRFYNRTRTRHPGSPIALFFSDHGHQRAQNKAPEAAYRNALQHAWFDYYVRGIGAEPYQGVHTFTQVCGGPSAGPYQAATWEELAAGEVRIESAAQQIIATVVATDAQVGRAFDPISGSGACATASAADQAGAATYRSAPMPAGGVTLMGSPTIIADILSPGPTSQIAARLLDVDPATGQQTLVARGLYRPEVGTTASCQVFQLHPNGYAFKEGHIIKLELLPADQPYGRNSNGQAPIAITNLRLQLPVVDSPDGTLVHARSPKVLPPGYELAADVTVGVDDTCVGAVTTTTEAPATTTTVTTSTEEPTTTTTVTTTTTTLPDFGLSLSSVKAQAEKSEGAGNGRADVKGAMSVPPNFSAPPPFTVRVEDALALDVSHTFESCTTKASGKITCRDEDGEEDNRASFKPKGDGAMAFKISLRGQSISGPFAGPAMVTLVHDSAVVRSGTAGDCQSDDTRLICKQ
ncbi:MAG TPA: CocE/NonD family hydrolase [Candidatus Limnocylindrales bacterium]|nr:CocE/NonD family hydrolase [Candidatus Limnocylindrales bacterium]